ncbi:uncharacterized protein LOC108913038 [Anoplophora glabripennis]|uniref:uncharacterized protein LOC108913038 n=1 Tax=Anoplophora glabripennis TaxID=217634 RepID=UPI0008759E43|nr:uncharacterized protein LOC108913038 [Anoplophora glabripennis]
MATKLFFPVVVALFTFRMALADSVLCPDPSDAKELVYKQNVNEPAPSFGRTEKDYFIPKPEKTVTCIILSGTATGSIASLGFSDKGIKVKLVSSIKEGFDGVLEVYSK